ncbi:MAG: hypothetical protein DIZ80_10570 [endosymbiont of Galathealinum brachiosum]|uniref:Hydrolase n=1 Tax=endosymbiont of Galathealinum brachiosum TaxID=2200906 RepID=A0A370DEB0_9GAMM|nr:MAG: hypothetical protein DIZ80_10570 [endosymbiont of Galathealinum brachiosum]
MPFTPFHMGPGILIKALFQGGFSLMIFGWSQIVMDIQPLIVLLTHEGHLHGFSHTYIGATLLAIFSALSGKYLSELVLRWLDITNGDKPIIIVWWISFISAFIGTYSHVLLDSLMHADLQPYYPFSNVNHLLGLLNNEQIYLLCIITAITGVIIYFTIIFLCKKPNPFKKIFKVR